ncbi:hypothetical protein G7062_10975 [Erysipelothrix sp. HDW6C]|uniref:hypothetical protein n=1 Tax=Erysipelothrix sp. HDW6C TaxID=2714930 RepID=UPI001409470B|nr:hypothetical protein [Erysipelothrix sp. HDW6C]QIK70782.1 hypothetical protein G7062_10975 [Erysipelothrix sp. HDW6C]
MKFNKRKAWQIAAIVVVFVIIDVWKGNTYNFMNVASMLYLSFFILVIAGILFIDRDNYKKFFGTFGIIAATFAVLFVVGGLMSSKLINAKRYANVIGPVKQVNFADLYSSEHTVEMSYVDKDSAILAAEKKIGELDDLSSRFEIDVDEFSQINYQGKMVRVAPFQYTDTLKKYMNFSDGVPYYVMVTTGDGNLNAQAKIVTMDEPMKYYPDAPLQYDLHRHVALHHKFSYLDDWYFEIDDAGHPYWLVQGITKRVGLWGAKDMNNLIIVDAVTGETKKYELDEIPEWVDSVYPTSMLMAQAKDYYTLKGGYINSIMQQKGVMSVDSEEGSYNYVSIDDEIYIFAGVRPIKLDSSSTTGLLFMNRRTGEAMELALPGVSLTSAQMTAVGSIQEKGYTPTTPTLQNVGGFPTYVMSLKDASGVVRGLSYVNYQDYTKSAVGDTSALAEKAYLNVMGSQEGLVPEDVETIEAKVLDVRQVLIDGNTFYLFTVEGHEGIFQAPLILDDRLAFMATGNTIKFTTTATKVTAVESIK